ncbi:LysR family transcriptional regulator [Tropicimonas sediminicola]|uniref:Transcriptional regulator, LysR family n=1 Tax=Tropicimonas sediminicola TaxID=1031541 RepID=A0A239FV45_9RHOB|nr:LysR family transcriptional regulator [Tropicimonas sediminicola]SNS60897.1 transcriptional regulator, LysR family [Tropicimonas sediminicola]
MDQLLAMRSFARVAQTGSFQEAAKLEGLAQGTISKRIAALETHLGVQLLRRNARQVTLTTLGETYLENCQRVLRDLDAGEAQLQADAGTPAGNIRLSMSPVLSRIVIAPLLVEFLREYPRIEVVSFLTEQHLDIVGEAIDVAIRASHLQDSTLIASRLSSNPLTLVAAPGYLEGAPGISEPEDLASHNCLTFGRMKASQTWRFTRGRTVRDIPVSGNLTADQGDTLVEFAVAGAGVVLMPEWVMDRHIANGELVRLLPEWSPPAIPLHIVYAGGSVVPLRIRLLVDFIRRNVRARDLLLR